MGQSRSDALTGIIGAQIAAPFQWKFTRQDLSKLLAKTDTPQPADLAA